LGGFSDRVGALAYALTPLTVLLGTRESILTLITGIPYQHFNFLHRWCGRIIFVQSVIHTIGWTIIEGRLYQPQPKVYGAWLNQLYMIFGCVALLFIFFLTVFSTKRAIRWTGYEFFKITHSAVAVLYIGACWGHWDRLWCWMVPSLILMALDQSLRLARTFYTHTGTTSGRFGFHRAMASVQAVGASELDDACIRLDFDFDHEAWQPGQHFYLTFPGLSIWQSHPFTIASSPDPTSKTQHHTYLLRARKGQTAELASLAGQTIPTIMTGPYGPGLPGDATSNVLTVAGGTGVTFTLPIVIASLKQSLLLQALVEFVWVVRRAQDLLWLDQELGELKTLLRSNAGLHISIFVTREHQESLDPGNAVTINTITTTHDPEKTGTSSSSSLSNYKSLQGLLSKDHERFSIEYLGKHPSMSNTVDIFMARAGKRGGYIQVIGSGPDSMASDLRSAVAKADELDGLNFYWDSRE
jgi:predicted ferric reductase